MRPLPRIERIALLLAIVACWATSSSCQSTRSAGRAEAAVGPEGGEVSLSLGQGSVVLRVPKGALSSTVKLYARLGQRLTGATWEAVEIGPPEVQLSEPVEVELSFQSRSLPPHVPHQLLHLATLEAGSWRLLETTKPALQSVAARTRKLGTFAVVPRCHAAGAGYRFQLAGCAAFNTSIETSVPVQLLARAGAVSLAMALKAEPSATAPVELKVGGLVPLTTYFLKVDGGETTELQSSQVGEVMLRQHLDTDHLLLLSSVHGSIQLTSTTCAPPIGQMVFGTGLPTCRLTSDILDAEVTIAADNFALDCRGIMDPTVRHVIGNNTARRSFGVMVANRHDVGIRNCIIRNVDTGISVQSSPVVVVENLRVEEPPSVFPSSTGTAISHVDSPSGTYFGVTVVAVGTGLFASASDGLWVTLATFVTRFESLILQNQTLTRLEEVTIDDTLSRVTVPTPRSAVALSNLGSAQVKTVSVSGQTPFTAAIWALSSSAVLENLMVRGAFGGVGLQTSDVTMSDSTLTENSVGLNIVGGTSRIFRNNIYNNHRQVVSTVPQELSRLIDPGPPAAVGEGNFWGHPCPGTLFTASADSNALDVVDSFPFANPSAWTFEAPGCADRRACGGGGSLCTLPNGCGGATACTLIGHETGGCLCQPPVFGGGASQTTCTVCGEAGTLTCDLSTCEPVARCTRPEVCNRCDDDGDGQIDNGVPTQGYFRDVDGDGFGAAGSAAIPLACSAVTPGFVLNNTDCNDSNARIHPGTAEVCDNMLDDDCDGAVNEGTPSVTFEVKDQTGATVEGAEVFVDGVSYGTTDSSGILTATNLPCGNLFAFARHRDPKTDEPAYRPNATGWVARYWKTSRVVELDGSVTDHLIFNPNALQTLRLDPKNTMIGWRLTAALDWDATKAELDHIAFIIKEASYDLYNLTDGQFFIEDAEIIDDVDSYGNPGVPWQRAELALSVDSTVHEHATALGGFTGPMNGYNPVIWISPFDEVGGLEASSTYVHELGHLAMGLADEYNVEGFVNPFAQCTAMRTTSHPEFGRGRPRAACVMDDHSVTSKLCSRHNDSSHRHASQQPGPCWDTVASGWKDPAGRTDRWEVVTPDQRNSTKLVGKLERLPAGLDVNPKIVPSVTDPLCDPFPISDPNGAAAAGSPVWVRSRPGATVRRDFTVGKLTESGSMRVRGVHVGDTVLTKLSSGTVTAVAGSPGACVVGF